MATVKMMQGDSYAVFFALRMLSSQTPITPDMLSEVEVLVGEPLRKTYTSNEVYYDDTLQQWYFVPTQEDTFALDPGSYPVQARVKFRNGAYSVVKGIDIGAIIIQDANSEEVI